MSENVLNTLQRLVQDVIAPDVRELKVRLTSFEKLVDERFVSISKEMDTRFTAMEERFDSQARQTDTRFRAVMDRLDSQAQQAEIRLRAMEERLDAQAKQHDAQFQAIMSAISESRAQANLAGMREIGQLRERVAVIESRLPAKAS